MTLIPASKDNPDSTQTEQAVALDGIETNTSDTNTLLTAILAELGAKTEPANSQKVNIDQATPGTTNKVSLGTDIITTKIDQTTPGTTNKVTLGSDAVTVKIDQLTHGANNVVAEIDQTTSGTTNKVTVQFIDEAGAPYGIKHVQNKPRVSAMTYLQDIAEGNVSGHEYWEKIGFTVVSGTTTKDVWSASDVTIPLPSVETAMEVYTNHAQDRASSIHSGTSTDGTTTTLIDNLADFTAGTAVAVGDLVVLDKSGTTPEYGYVTSVIDANTLEILGGFSSGGSGTTRAYAVIDVSAYTGAHAVMIKYLDDDYAEHSEIVLLGGASVGVDLVNTNTFRINDFEVISCGSDGITNGEIKIQDADGTSPTYSFITAGYTIARNSQYTVPAGKTLYVVQVSSGYASTSNQIQSARIILKAMQHKQFRINHFHALDEFNLANVYVPKEYAIPLKISPKVTIKFTAVPTANGNVTTCAKGWLE